MRGVSRWPGFLAACLLTICLAGAARSAEDKPTVLEPKTIDQMVNTVLHDVIDHGADLYNSGDQNGCYRLYEGALMSVRPFLAYHADWQKEIDASLADARRSPESSQRAFVLRAEIDKIRKAVKEGTKPEDKPKTTLWERLGGEAGVKKVVDDFIEVAANDKGIDLLRGGKYKDVDVKQLKQQVVNYISSVTGGPLAYKGKDMKTAHKGMGITEVQFDAFMIDLRAVLKKNNVKDDDITAVMAIINGARKDIVEPAPEKKDK